MMQVSKLAVVLLLLSAISFAQGVAPTTKALRDMCTVAMLETVNPGWSSGDAAANWGRCMGTVTMWMDMANNYLLDRDPEPMQMLTVGPGGVKVRELVQEFVEVSAKHPEWDKESAVGTLAFAAVARGWYVTKPYVSTTAPASLAPAPEKPAEKGWKTLPGGLRINDQ